MGGVMPIEFVAWLWLVELARTVNTRGATDCYTFTVVYTTLVTHEYIIICKDSSNGWRS